VVGLVLINLVSGRVASSKPAALTPYCFLVHDRALPSPGGETGLQVQDAGEFLLGYFLPERPVLAARRVLPLLGVIAPGKVDM